MRIGIIRMCGLGDAVQLTPLLQQIRADQPRARVEVFINTSAAPVLEGCPWVDTLHAIADSDMADDGGGFLWRRLWRQVRRAGRFSTLLHLDLRWSRGALLRAMNAERTATFVTGGRKPWRAADLLLTVPVAFTENARHTSLWYLDLWRAAAGGEDRRFDHDVTHLLDPQPPAVDPRRVALLPGASRARASDALKRWPDTHWRELAERLLATGWAPVFVGTDSDFPAAEIPPGAGNALQRPEPAGIRRAARTIASCAGAVGHDTGLYQVALGLGVPTVGLFGPTSPLRTGPLRLPNPRAVTLTHPVPCTPCYRDRCLRNPELHPGAAPPFCLSLLTPREVHETATRLFANQPAAPPPPTPRRPAAEV